MISNFNGLIQNISQDITLMHMIQEQDIVDRREIALYGMKSNHQIVHEPKAKNFQLDKNCATCMTNFAPQLLSHLKMACLNYQNAPI